MLLLHLGVSRHSWVVRNNLVFYCSLVEILYRIDFFLYACGVTLSLSAFASYRSHFFAQIVLFPILEFDKFLYPRRRIMLQSRSFIPFAASWKKYIFVKKARTPINFYRKRNKRVNKIDKIPRYDTVVRSCINVDEPHCPASRNKLSRWVSQIAESQCRDRETNPLQAGVSCAYMSYVIDLDRCTRIVVLFLF